MLISTVGNLGWRFVVNLSVSSTEKKSEMPVALFKPTLESLKVFTQLLKGNEITSHIWSYLTPKEVGISFSVSKLWKEATSSNPLWATLHKRTFFSENKVPSLLKLTTEESLCLSEICKTRYLETQVEIDALFPNKMGAGFYSEYLGEVKAPSIPEEFIKRAKEVDPFDREGRLVKDTHLLVYVPKEITITIPADSNLILKEGRLMKKWRLLKYFKASSQKEKTLTVPMTINNLSMLIIQCLKKGHTTEIHKGSWEKILNENGNKPVEAHFSYLRKDIVGSGMPYQAQITLARDNRYKVTSLIDRVLLNLLTYVSSGVFVDRYMARTSTSVVFNGTTHQAASGCWESLLFLGSLNDPIHYNSGVALEVFSGSLEIL